MAAEPGGAPSSSLGLCLSREQAKQQPLRASKGWVSLTWGGMASVTPESRSSPNTLVLSAQPTMAPNPKCYLWSGPP